MTPIPKLQLFNNLQITYPVLNPTFRSSSGVDTITTEYSKDSFSTNPAYESLNGENRIKTLAESSPEIMTILSENNIPLKLNLQDFEKLKRGHLLNTRVTVAKMYSSLPPELKQQVNMQNLQTAAMFHDVGKILIPSDILNKEGSLTPNEKQIMDKHSELGALLLEKAGMNQQVTDLVKYHHQNLNGTGYPRIDNYEFGTASQMLAAADKHSALTEKRTYHNPYSKQEALNIIQKDVDSGGLSPEVFEALKQSV